MRCIGVVIGVVLHGCMILPAAAQEEKNSSPPSASSGEEISAKAIEALLSDKRQAARLTHAEADKVVGELPDAFPGVKKYDLLNAVYKLLKPEVKQQPEHSVKARLLAALARTSRQRITDIAEAEQLDLLLNPDQPDAWLRRGISYAKMKEEKWAADMFLEGLRRTDFSRPPEFFTTLAPPTAGWVARISKAKRTDELNSALADAFVRTKPGTAGIVAFTMLQAVLDVEDTPLQPQRLALLLKSVREHQQHLMLSHMAQFHARVHAWAEAGHHDAATTLARALVLAPLDGGDGAGREQEQGQEAGSFTSTAMWGEKPWTVDVRGMIPALMKIALREPHADFLAEAEVVGQQHPRDTHLISCVLLARANVSPLTPEALQLSQALDPVSRLQVAWRLGVLAPAGHVEPCLLGPWFAEGLPALLRAPDVANGAGANVRQAMQLIPWMEKSGHASALPALIPMLRKGLVKQGASGEPLVNADLWPQLLVLAVLHGDAQEREACAEAWREGCQRRRQEIAAEWKGCRHTARTLVDAMVTASPDQGRELARLAFQAWSEAWSRSLKEGDSDGVTAALILDALLSASLNDELAAFEKQVRNELTFGGVGPYPSILKRLQFYRALLQAESRKLPPARVKVHDALPDGGFPRVAWSFEMQGDLSERHRLEAMEGDAYRSPYQSPKLHALSGRYDVDVYAGESPEELRKVSGAEAVSVEGEILIKDLPPAGWVRLMVKYPRNGIQSFSQPAAYCIRDAELHSKRAPRGPVPVWPQDLRVEFGTPMSDVIPIQQGTEYLLRVDLEGDSLHPDWRALLPQGIQLVALDESQKPVGVLLGMERDDIARSVGPAMAVLRPDRWVAENGCVREADSQVARDGWTKVHYLVLTSEDEVNAQAPAVRLQKFISHEDGPVPGQLPFMEAEFLALVDLEARTWFISNIRPRAVVGGPGSIRVYDTSTVPWRQLKHYESRSLLGRESVFMFHDNQFYCMEWPCDGRPDAALRVVPLESDLPYEGHERRILPMNPLRSEVAVDESGVIFTAPSEGAFRTKFRALWLGADGRILEAKAERPPIEGRSEVAVAWWGKDGTLGICEAGRMFHLKVTPDALLVEKQESGIASFDTVPAGAEPSSHLWQPRFLLKNPRMLLRLDQKTGEVITGYWLPYVCRGSPIWMADENSPALLTTDQGELIRVAVPPPAK